jgi:DNA-directed RNA polymerase specialized sigma24 family protein
LYARLVRFFEWQGCQTPEDAADTTFDRAIRKIDAGASVPDVPRYINGIARLVLKEYRRIGYREVSLDIVDKLPNAAPDTSDDNYQVCVERCLRRLPSDGSTMLLEYFSGGNRDQLASKRGMTLNALRIRISKLKEQLRKCAVPCATGNAKGMPIV